MRAGLLVVVVLGLSVANASAQGSVDKGMKVFAESKCSMCHSIDGKGNAKGALDEVGSKLSAADIKAWIGARLPK